MLSTPRTFFSCHFVYFLFYPYFCLYCSYLVNASYVEQLLVPVRFSNSFLHLLRAKLFFNFLLVCRDEI